MKVTKIRAGLYEVTAGGRRFTVEDMYDGQHWTWRVVDPEPFHDGWIGDYRTKRAAIAAIAGLVDAPA
ncbi:hypothetical protein PBI_KRATIO_67 [Mycobacterium phage Kratio]|uniref:Uncharacterized protein n=1 Tax=Mycobacterium phage Kratio TaxID=1606763 RepID=A0A0C5AAM2_9CAUD|nr:hypothetical protein PBI_KRATIO_67 [Mycobacterium phage Kratio]AJK27396.1 hypothetical protein PBI_KRATIO_67 [Mycobacterium phage Kratio]